MKTLGVSDNFNLSSYSHSDPVNNAIRTYENHPSVKNICKTITLTSTFHFSGADKPDEGKQISNLNSSKVGAFKNIPTKCLKVTFGISNPFLAANWNEEFILNTKIPIKIKASQ